ncbi:MAG: hypothetical protein AB7I48_19805 [Planctomycetaceae bacterium]
MRRILTILVLTAIVAVPSLSIAKNPFDFSDWARKSRTETWSAEDSTTAEAPVSPQTDARAVPPSAGPQVKNYADELFNEPPRRPAAEPTPTPPTRPSPWTPTEYRDRRSATTAPVGRPRLAEVPVPAGRFTRDDLNSRKSEETLQRFDEFLKTRDVVQAEFEQAKDASVAGKIQPVAETIEPTPENAGGSDEFWELKATASPRRKILTDSEASTGQQPNAADSQDASDRFSFLEENPAEAAAAGNRLTETIPITPVSPTAKAEPPARAARNPFAFDATPAANARPEPPISINSAPPSQEGRSRFSISRAAPAPSVETPNAGAEAASTVPSSTPRAASISAVWNPKGPLNIGQECPCELVVTNLRKNVAEDVSIETQLPSSVQLVDAAPAPTEQTGTYVWQLNSLAPGEERRIQVVLLATQTGTVELTAQVRSTDSHVQSLTVAEPQLDVTVSGPSAVSVGEPATQTVVVRNPGSGVATNITLEARVPEGLEHVRGNRLVMNIGSLNPGETRQVRLALAAVGGGQQILQVEARADAGLVQTASAELTVAAPKLKASIDGPGLRYLGREAMYTLRVENEGATATDAVQMVHRIPEGFEFVRSDRGARFDEKSRMLTWFVGRLGADQPQDLHVTLVAKQAGEFVHAVRAASEHGSYSDAQLTTRVEGTASLVVEVADLDDPVEVGSETAYEVTITNEGTASSHDVSLACEIPGGLTLLKAAGPSEHRAKTNAVEFQPVAEVGAGETLTYRVYVKGTESGDKRFRCRLTSAHLSQPLFTEEFTKFYGE